MIDTSGSTSQKNRISHIREAAKWVINTLSEADFAMVVQFNGAARSQGEKLLPVRKQASTRTAMQHICHRHLLYIRVPPRSMNVSPHVLNADESDQPQETQGLH